MHSRIRALLVCLAVLFLILPAAAAATGPVTGTYKVAIVRIRYSDSPSSHTYTNAQMDQAMGEIHTFFSELSYGQLNMQLTWKDVTLSNNTAHYWTACPVSEDPGRYCLSDDLFRDAAEAAAV